MCLIDLNGQPHAKDGHHDEHRRQADLRPPPLGRQQFHDPGQGLGHAPSIPRRREEGESIATRLVRQRRQVCRLE